MSIVSSVFLCTGCGSEDEGLWPRVNAWLVDRGFGVLARLEDHCGGGKVPQACFGGAGFNFFDESEFANFVMALPWGRPENVVLIIDPEEGATRTWRPVAPHGEHMQLGLSDAERIAVVIRAASIAEEERRQLLYILARVTNSNRD